MLLGYEETRYGGYGLELLRTTIEDMSSWISILSDSDRIEINFNFKTAHVWKIVNYPVAILARTLPSLSHTFH